MLSESYIDNLMQPVVDRQEAINLYVIKEIAGRIARIGEILPTDAKQLEQLLHTGNDIRKINKKLAELTGLQEKEIKRTIKEAGENVYNDTKPYYDYRKKPFIPYQENEPIQRIVSAVAKQTAGTYRNLAQAQAFMIRDLKNPNILKPTKIAEAYQSIVDEAIQAAQSGVVSYNVAMERSLKQIIDSGLIANYNPKTGRYSVTYNPKSGRTFTQSLDAAVKRNLLDGIRAVNQGVQDETGKQFGADGKELTVHALSAPDHEPMQGRQFTMEQFERLNNQMDCESYPAKGQQKVTFKAIKRPISKYNCKHFAYNVILGVAPPNYSDEELQHFVENNKKGYTLPDGKHITGYECTQMQRMYERNIRKNKYGQIAALKANNPELAQKYQSKVDDYTKKYKAFSDACGLSLKTNNIKVQGYKRKSFKK